jgi:ABC-2 type transport system ATP-binding protein
MSGRWCCIAAMGAISAEGLVKVFPSRSGEVRALDGVDLDVPTGSVLGLLGPNGAGKTTTVRILTTLLIPDAGRATVNGIDVADDPQGVRRSIGLSGQYAAVDEYLTGRENLHMVGRLYHLAPKESAARARELLEEFDLVDAADRPTKTYSGGMRRRLDLAGALVARPPIIFLDEPTTGLDPRSRIGLWEVIDGLVAQGTTVLLTTQYLDEADKLADSIAVVDRGRVIARGTSDELKARVGGERLAVTVGPGQVADAREVLAALATGAIDVDEHARSLVAPVAGGAGALLEAVRAFDDRGVRILDIGVRRPTLDDVFLQLTGHHAEEDGPEPGAGGAGGAAGAGAAPDGAPETKEDA